VNHKIGKMVFALVVGVLAATLSYRWVANPVPHTERLYEERVVEASRIWLESTLAIGQLVIVDPLTPDRKVGKVYVYPRDGGWEVSGFYRRDASDLWHPYLISMDGELALTHIKISDTALLQRDGEGRLEVLP